jgi:hypothetical protein
MKGPTMTAIKPKMTEYKPKAEGNLSRLYSANTRGSGTWMKLLAKPRNPVMSATARKSLKRTKAATTKQNQKQNIKGLKELDHWITGSIVRDSKEHIHPEIGSVSVLR